MIRFEKDFPFYEFEGLGALPGVINFVSSGVKNIGFSDSCDEQEVEQGRRLLALAVGFEVERLVTLRQTHSDHVVVVTSEDAGRGALEGGSRIPDADALVTAESGLCLMVLSADCVLVLLCDPVKKVVGAIHAGWRGTAAGIVKKTVEVMQNRFGCRAEDILAGIGPSIGRCCFEVGGEVAGVFREMYSNCVERKESFPDKYWVDLWEVNRRELIGVGLQESHVEVVGFCSVCHSDRFFSYRRDGLLAGRFGAGIMLRSEGLEMAEKLPKSAPLLFTH